MENGNFIRLWTLKPYAEKQNLLLFIIIIIILFI